MHKDELKQRIDTHSKIASQSQNKLEEIKRRRKEIEEQARKQRQVPS